MKRLSSLDDLAIFGARRLFATPRPIGQLDVPDPDTYLALLRTAFEARCLTGGDIVRTLEARLAERHRTRHCVAVANAGLGLMMLMRIFSRGRAGEIIMPGFTFRGLPHFARWAGLTPRYCDVRPDTHGLDPGEVEASVGPTTVAILAVCNANSPGDIDGLCAVAAAHGLPIFFDSVYGLAATYRGRPLGGYGQAEVFSLHATKLLNGFEGGYITTDDDGLAETLRRQRQFPPRAGCADPADAHPLGLNAMLNEMHGAMALCCLDGLGAVIERNRTRYRAYERVCAPLPGLDLLPYLDEGCEARNYCMAILSVDNSLPLSRDQVLGALRAEGCAINSYYSPPLHRTGSASLSLPVTDELAARFVQLPVGERVSLEDIARIGEVLSLLAARGEEIAARLDEAGQ